MVLRLALLAVALVGCVQPNRHGAVDAASPDARAPDTGAPDAPTPDGAAVRDTAAALDATSPDVAPPDTTAAECTPRAIGCGADGRSVRTCSDEGRWMVTSTCGAGTTCSGGLCLCAPETCNQGPIHQVTGVTGLVHDLAGGGGALFLAADGPQSSIRRLDLQTRAETVVHMGGAEFTNYALDVDATGDLVWCSQVVGPPASGELVHGSTTLDQGACTHVRRHGGFLYYRANDALYRSALDGKDRQLLTSELMDIFEVAGDQVYFAGEAGGESVLGRVSLADGRFPVETVVHRPGAPFTRVMSDAAHVYVLSADEIFRVAQVQSAPAETFWRAGAAEPWAMAQTDSHVYWTTTTAGAAGCSQAQVWRQAKAGGPPTVMATLQGRCGGELVVLGSDLYALVWTGPSGAVDVLRIRL
jgi:hypothetical protein